MLSSLLLMALPAAGLIALASVRRIPEGQAYTLRRVGGHTRTLNSGTHLVLPLLERVAHKINLTGNKVYLESVPADGKPLRGVLYFQILDAARADDVFDGLPDLLRERASSLLAQAELPDSADERRLWLKQGLNAELHRRGLLITRVELNRAD